MERKGSVASTASGVNEMDVAEVEKHFGIHTESEPLKGAWACKMGGGVGSNTGKLFLTSQHLCYYGKGMLSQSSKTWEFSDLLDVDKSGSGKNISIVLVTFGAKKYTFTSLENVDKTMNTIQRVLYGSIGNTSIHQAVEQKDYDKVKALLEYDPTKLNSFNKAEQLPLHLAFSKNDAEMVRLLLDYYGKNRSSCDINLPHEKTRNTSLHTACMSPNLSDKIMKDMLSFDGIDVDVKNADDNTPLHYYCEKTASLECKKVGKMLIMKSKDPKQLVSQPNLNKETAMHKVMFNRQVRGLMVHLLMKYSADLNVKSKLGNTPLHYAIRYHREGLVRALIKGGANTSILTSNGQSPLELAIEERKGIQPGTSTAEQESHESAVEIEQILTHIEELQSMLKRVGLSDLATKFIKEELYEPDVLASVTEQTLEKLGMQIKVGPQIKLMKEIESFKTRLAEQRAEEEKKREEEKKLKPAVDDDAEDDTLVEDPNKIRSNLGLEGSWEIRYDELEFTKKLGAGASGQVYKGICRGKEVAIKVLTNVSVEETMEEFKKELSIMTTVRSPYMVTFFGATISPKLCMVMELCSKGSLYHVLNDKSFNWSWDLMFRAALDMSYGMDVLHSWEPPIVHRDLKSLNLLVTSDFRIKVCDFGLSRFTAGGNLETFKKLCGTFAYCAPEIFNGGTFTGRSDVFSMGMVIWELLIKLLKGKYEQPYSEFKNLTYDFQIIVQAASGLRPTLPDQCPASFKKLYSECTASQVESRPTASQIVDRLKDIRKEYRKDKEAWDALVVA